MVYRAVYLFVAVGEVKYDTSVGCASEAGDFRYLYSFLSESLNDSFASGRVDAAEHVVPGYLGYRVVDVRLYVRHEFVECEHVSDYLLGGPDALTERFSEGDSCAEQVRLLQLHDVERHV